MDLGIGMTKSCQSMSRMLEGWGQIVSCDSLILDVFEFIVAGLNFNSQHYGVKPLNRS